MKRLRYMAAALSLLFIPHTTNGQLVNYKCTPAPSEAGCDNGYSDACANSVCTVYTYASSTGTCKPQTSQSCWGVPTTWVARFSQSGNCQISLACPCIGTGAVVPAGSVKKICN